MEEKLRKIIYDNFLLQHPEHAFYSEASVQHKMGLELYKYFSIEAVLEKKILGKKEYLDLYIKEEKNSFGIEIKYKTMTVENDHFEYINQGAQNNGKYDFIHDIHRLEKFKYLDNLIQEGYAILITNDKSYWTEARRGSKISHFDLVDKRILPSNFVPSWKGRSASIKLKKNYELSWIASSGNENFAQFRSCIVKI